MLGEALSAEPYLSMAHSFAFVSVSKDKVLGFLDTATLTRSGDKATAWSLYIGEGNTEKMNGRTVRKSLFQAEFDCTARTRRALYGITFDPAGKIISELPLLGSRSVEPKSVDETMFNSACNPSTIHTTHIFDSTHAAIEFADFSVKNLK